MHEPEYHYFQFHDGQIEVAGTALIKDNLRFHANIYTCLPEEVSTNMTISFKRGLEFPSLFFLFLQFGICLSLIVFDFRNLLIGEIYLKAFLFSLSSKFMDDFKFGFVQFGTVI
jgi:hypothetical protein